MNKEKYIGLILDERNDHYTIGYRETTDFETLKKWKEEMLECSNVEDCKILKVEEIEREKLDIEHNVVNKQSLYSEIETLIIKWNIDGTKTAGSLTRDIMKLLNVTLKNKAKESAEYKKIFKEIKPNRLISTEYGSGIIDSQTGEVTITPYPTIKDL